jgi:hypothetical protein
MTRKRSAGPIRRISIFHSSWSKLLGHRGRSDVSLISPVCPYSSSASSISWLPLSSRPGSSSSTPSTSSHSSITLLPCPLHPSSWSAIVVRSIRNPLHHHICKAYNLPGPQLLYIISLPNKLDKNDHSFCLLMTFIHSSPDGQNHRHRE